MRNSKFLKGLCYILIPILLLILCISVLYELDKNDYDYYNNDLNYFETDAFLADYMFVLSDKAYKHRHCMRRLPDELIYKSET